MEIVPTVRESALYMSVEGPYMKIGLWSAGPVTFSCNLQKKTRDRDQCLPTNKATYVIYLLIYKSSQFIFNLS